ncbi:MAG: thioredoxin [Muribaculaceae bacterium]|nr:thioredoxin [Muribaculaceae bacterium]
MDNFQSIVNGQVPVLVDFYATWCAPCRMQSPIIKQVKETVGDMATVIKINVDANETLAAKYGISSIPTLLIIKNGEVVWRASGVQQADVLVQKIKEFATV